MEKYEITYLVESEDKSKAVKELITSTGASYQESKDWGERELAYPIKRFTKAYYYTGVIETIPTNISEIKKKLNFSDVLVRYLIIRKEE